MELDMGVKYLVERLEASIGPELKRIEDKDWSVLEGDKLKKVQNVQKIWTQRNIDHATKLYIEAEKAENLYHPQVKAFFQKVIRLVEIYEQRYGVFYDRNDWGKYMDSDEDDELDDKEEAELFYQSSLMNNLIDFRQKTLKFDLTNTKEKIHVPSFSKTPIPYGMKDAVLAKYPEVKEFLDRRLEEHNKKKHG